MESKKTTDMVLYLRWTETYRINILPKGYIFATVHLLESLENTVLSSSQCGSDVLQSFLLVTGSRGTGFFFIIRMTCHYKLGTYLYGNCFQHKGSACEESLNYMQNSEWYLLFLNDTCYFVFWNHEFSCTSV